MPSTQTSSAWADGEATRLFPVASRSEPAAGETVSLSDDPEPAEQPKQLLPFAGVDQALDQMPKVHVWMPVIDTATVGLEVDTAVPVADTIDLAILHTIDRPNLLGSIGHLDGRRLAGAPLGWNLPGEARQRAEGHHEGHEHRRRCSPHVHPFRCVPYRRDRTPGFDAVGGMLRRLASSTMRKAIVTLTLAVIGFGIYGVAVDSPFVSYYVPITIALAALVGWIHRTARFADSTLMALALAGIGNLAGGVLLVGDGPLYSAAVLGDIRYDKVFHALATGVAGWACYEAVRRWGVARRGAAIFVAVMMAGGAGAFVEIIEYVGSVIFENTSVGDYGNNMLDLVANTAGSVVGVVWASRVVDRRSPVSDSGSG